MVPRSHRLPLQRGRGGSREWVGTDLLQPLPAEPEGHIRAVALARGAGAGGCDAQEPTPTLSAEWGMGGAKPRQCVAAADTKRNPPLLTVRGNELAAPTKLLQKKKKQNEIKSRRKTKIRNVE